MNPNHHKPTPDGAELADLRRLIAASSDEGLAPEDHDRLERMLAGSRDARAMYIAYMQLDAGLDWNVRGGQSLDGMLDLSRKVASTPAAANGARRPRDGVAHRSRLRYAAIGLAASLACVLATVAWYSSTHGIATGGLADTSPLMVPSERFGEPALNGEMAANIVALSEDCRWFLENRREADGAIRPGDKIRLTSGQLRMEFVCGAAVTMKSPAALEIISPMRTRAVLGTLTAHVEKGAEGFTVETPRTTVVDLGTDFGIEVTDRGSTDVVVFTGAVDLHSEGVEGLKSRQRLNAGEAVRVSGEGTASRIVSITDSQFSIPDSIASRRHREPVISDVRDNIRRGESWHYYEIVHGGMHEDAKAFVDRKDHEWNGIDARGIPSYLLGADYVKTFNDDKLNREVEIQVTLNRPAILYVLLDKRSPVPDWLRDSFFNTGDEIGIDGGGYTRMDHRKTISVGPGRSIDDTFSIWRRDVPAGGTVTLGAIQLGGETHNMYGIVAVPLEFHGDRDDFPGLSDHPCAESSPIASTSAGKLSIDGAIELPADVDVFRFDWSGEVVEVSCDTNGFTTLDPVVAIYDANETLVGYARSIRSKRDRAAITMTLPPGVYYAAVTGADEVGEVGVYHLQIAPSSGDVAPPQPPSPSLVLNTAATGSGIQLSWNELPLAESYVVERSDDAVSFKPVATTPGAAAIDTEIEAGSIYVYRVRARGGPEAAISAPLLVRASPLAVTRLQSFGQSPQSVVLEWRDALGEESYRIERSVDGAQFDTIGTAPQNASGYRDLTVEPGRQYFYRVATVGMGGESLLSGPVGAFSGVGEFTATAITGDQVRLRWKAEYPHGRFFIERAEESDSFVTIAALNGDTRKFVDRHAPSGKELRYRVIAVDDTTEPTALMVGEIDDIRLPDDVREDHFALRFTGKLRIDKPARYSFYLNSDDGSRLFIDGSLVVDNDGRHAPRMVYGTTRLAPGEHDLEIHYFEHDGRALLELLWAGSGAPLAKVPTAVLSSLTCHYYEGTWWRLPFARTSARSETVTVSTAQDAKDFGR